MGCSGLLMHHSRLVLIGHSGDKSDDAPPGGTRPHIRSYLRPSRPPFLHSQIEGVELADLTDGSSFNTHLHMSLVSALGDSDAIGPGVSHIRLSAPTASLLMGHTNMPFAIDGYGTVYGDSNSAFTLAATDLGNMWDGELTTCVQRNDLRSLLSTVLIVCAAAASEIVASCWLLLLAFSRVYPSATSLLLLAAAFSQRCPGRDPAPGRLRLHPANRDFA